MPTNSKIQDSFLRAANHLAVARIEVVKAVNEVRKWRHPVDGEIAGIEHQLLKKIDRLEELAKR